MTPLPFFYHEEPATENSIIELDGDTSRHITGVLRMKMGDALHLTDGLGHLLTTEIAEEFKKKCSVRVNRVEYIEPAARKVTVALSLLKNKHRFEWFLE
ncbi:MAG: RsmE family RNA methyltransferase, partial [Bacteroidetes bacterium]|nr:RsmE family RNA methyltransferase [Bacteroidota bacterium]